MDIDNAERAADLEKRLKNRSSNEKIPDEAEKNSRIRTEIEAEDVADGARSPQGAGILSEPSENLVFIGIVTDCQKVVILCSGMIGQNCYEIIT